MFFSEHDWKGAVQLLETAIATFDENDAHYCRLREKINAKIAAEKCFDHLYATRHGGQFILYVSNYYKLFLESYVPSYYKMASPRSTSNISLVTEEAHFALKSFELSS